MKSVTWYAAFSTSNSFECCRLSFQCVKMTQLPKFFAHSVQIKLPLPQAAKLCLHFLIGKLKISCAAIQRWTGSRTHHWLREMRKRRGKSPAPVGVQLRTSFYWVRCAATWATTTAFLPEFVPASFEVGHRTRGSPRRWCRPQACRKTSEVVARLERKKMSIYKNQGNTKTKITSAKLSPKTRLQTCLDN